MQIYNALIQPHLDYCGPVCDGLSNQQSGKKLQKLQNRAAMVILRANYETSSMYYAPRNTKLGHTVNKTKKAKTSPGVFTGSFQRTKHGL